APRLGDRAAAASPGRRRQGRRARRARRAARHGARAGPDRVPPQPFRSRHGHADRDARRPRPLLAAAQAPGHAAAAEGGAASRRSSGGTPLMAGSQAIALFDLDNTLLSGDSDYEWAQFLIERGVLDRSEYESKNDHFFRQYKEGRLDIHEFLDFQLAPLARHPREELDRWHAEFMRTRVKPIIRAKGRELVKRHIAQEHLCAIVTSTNAFITAPI